MQRSMWAALVAAFALVATPAGAAVSPAGGLPDADAVEIVQAKGPAPDWFTAEFAERVRQAGPDGLPLPDDAKVPVSSLAFLGIRPGQQLLIDDGAGTSLCSANFVFRNGSSNAIGTAGHCGPAGADVFMIALPLGIVQIGQISFSTFSDDKLAPDFALIPIDPALNSWVSPSMSHWGGPTGAFTGNGIQPVLHSGHGLVVGTGGTPRAGVGYQWGTEWRFEGVISPGDSGSGAIVAGGLAAGNITHIAVDTREGIPVWMGGTSISTILGLVGGWSLATCSVAIPWPLPGCPPV